MGFRGGATLTDSGCGYANPPVVLVQEEGGATGPAFVADSETIVTEFDANEPKRLFRLQVTQ